MRSARRLWLPGPSCWSTRFSPRTLTSGNAAAPSSDRSKQAAAEQWPHDQPVADSYSQPAGKRKARIRGYEAFDESASHQQHGAKQQHRADAVRAGLEGFAARRRRGPDDRLTEHDAGGAGDADDRQFHRAMRADEFEQGPCQAVLMHEGERAAQHQPVHCDQVQSSQAQEYSRAKCHDADDDVVREDAYRQNRGGHDIDDAFGPKMSLLHLFDHLLAGDETDQRGKGGYQPPTGEGT